METFPWEEFRSRQERVFTWLVELGLNRNDRLRHHQTNIARMLDAHASGRQETFRQQLDDLQRREFLWSICESIEFVEAVEPLIPYHTPHMTLVLEEALQGQPDLADESDRSNHGRNAVFELVVAGHLARAGMPVTFHKNPDVQTEYNGLPMLIECKRPFAQASVGRNLLDGAKQLRNHRKTLGDYGAYTIIALSVSRLFNTGNQMLAFRTERDMIGGFTAHLERFTDRTDHLLRAIQRYGVSAVWFHVGSPAMIAEQPGFTFRETAVITPVAATLTEALALRAFAKHVKLR